MKKLLLLVTLLTLLTVNALASGLNHVTDEANVLTAGQEASLQEMAEELYQKTGFDVILHTTNNSQGKTPFDYSMDYYHAYRSAQRYPNGAMFSILFDTRDYYEAARGTGIDLLSRQGTDQLAGVVQSRLSNADYYGAMANYIRYVSRSVIPPTPAMPMEKVTEYAPFILGGGMVIGLIYALILKSKIAVPKFRYDAQRYIIPNSLNLTDTRDIYLYQTTTRTRIESNSGGSGRSGGGFSSGSRGGTSYGGRGGKF